MGDQAMSALNQRCRLVQYPIGLTGFRGLDAPCADEGASGALPFGNLASPKSWDATKTDPFRPQNVAWQTFASCHQPPTREKCTPIPHRFTLLPGLAVRASSNVDTIDGHCRWLQRILFVFPLPCTLHVLMWSMLQVSSTTRPPQPTSTAYHFPPTSRSQAPGTCVNRASRHGRALYEPESFSGSNPWYRNLRGLDVSMSKFWSAGFSAVWTRMTSP